MRDDDRHSAINDEWARSRAAEAEVDAGNIEEDGNKEPKPLGQEAPEDVESASKIGAKRLLRPMLGDTITAFTGGMSAGFGAIAMASSVGGSLAEPQLALWIGALAAVDFLILLIGKTGLFTENFLLPVAAVLGRRGYLRQLGSLWSVTLGANLAGALVFAALASWGGVPTDDAADQMIALADHKVHFGLSITFIKALFAGWLMTTLTWLLVAAEGGLGTRIVVIWAIAALIVLAQFNHVVISAAEFFMAKVLGAPIWGVTQLTENFVPVLVGNVIGGPISQTMLHTLQARYQEPDTDAETPKPIAARYILGNSDALAIHDRGAL